MDGGNQYAQPTAAAAEMLVEFATLEGDERAAALGHTKAREVASMLCIPNKAGAPGGRAGGVSSRLMTLQRLKKAHTTGFQHFLICVIFKKKNDVTP